MAEQSRTTGPGEHFTISYAGFNRPWATWISHQLVGLGHQTTLLRWDPGPDAPLAGALGDLLDAPGRVLLLLDNWYFRLGPRTDEEWTEALREVVPPNVDRFAAVSVATRALPTTAAALRPVDLRDLDAVEARRLILRRLGLPTAPLPAGRNDAKAPRFPHDPPEIRKIPRRNDRFTGRDPVLEELYDLLTAGGSEGARCALHGISGVGKSQIAAEYAHRFGNDYDVVWWISANFRGTAREQLAELAPRLNLPVGQEIGDRIRAVHEALRVGRPFGRWLMVFDSADYMDQVEDLLPEGTGHVLLTTLTRDWSASGRAQEIEVLPFLREESVAYARRRAPRLTGTEADLLSEAVQDLPLLLAQTAAWLDTNAMPVKEYVELIRRGEPGQLGIGIGADYPMGFQTSWSITLNTLRDRSPAAAELLKLLAFFSPDLIPVRLVQAARPGDLPEHLATLVADPIGWHTALRRLSEATAVRLDYQSGPGQEAAVGNAQMHRLYHGFLRNELPDEERDVMSVTACSVLVSADPRRPSDTREWSRYAELIPHLKPAGALDSPDPAVQELILNCLEYLKLRGEYTTGLALCEQALARWRTRMPATHRTMLFGVHQHANMLRRSGRYREAEAVGRAVVEVLADREPDDTDLLRAKNGLGGSLMALARLTEAYELYDDVWRQYGGRLGEEDPSTIQARSNLGITLGLLGRYGEALKVHGENLAVRERLLRPEHHQTLQSGLSYAWMLRLLGRYPEAASRQELNARMHRQVMEANNPETLRAEHNLALCMRRNGDLVQAESLMRSVVARSAQVQGPRHPETLMLQADFATFTREHGDLEQSREMSVSVAERYRTLVGADHPYAVGTHGNTGLVLWEYGERDEALAIAEKALVGMVAAVGAEHPWALGCALNAAGARHLAGDEEGALELSRATAATAELVMGEAHPLTFSCKAALADDLRGLRRNEEANKLERQTLQQLSETLGAQHPHTMSVRRRERPYWDFEPQPI
ncbi:FxSxx-COOH system tetratricopeptide repeat protein [Actinacidiphila glaucinigra]|uniref:FxSxx-COOH system tetratricopeptide repeat protein n=1 Tax=Actinacidiphila glaucinigra TaxID=235986 RepID=UPI0033B77EBF